MKKLFREPLVHFLLLGAGLFLLFGWRAGSAPQAEGQPGLQSTKIVVSRGDIDQMVATFTRTWQRPPTEAEVKGLIENFVRDEIYYREALAIGLDRGDAVIRRRMRQKMEFIFEDLTARTEPTEEDLRTYLAEHPESYAVDPQISFQHVYINEDSRGESAGTDARRILAQLRKGADPAGVGDPILLASDNRLRPLWDIQKQYGDKFGDRLLTLEPGTWEGPVRSGFGLHLVLVRQHVGGRLPELDEVREMVRRDWGTARRQELKEAAYAKLRERYTVEFEKPKAGAGPAVAQTEGER